MRIKKLEQRLQRSHRYLEEGDVCYYFGEYTPRVGYSHSPTNQAILNLKKCVSHRGSPQYQYKEESISSYGDLLHQALNWNNPASLSVTWVPIPPSRAKSDPKYDDRMLQVLSRMNGEMDLDIRELVHQKESATPSHLSANRPNPQEIAANYEVDLGLTEPPPKTIAIVDDVLTEGAHFKAVQKVLARHFPGVQTFGVFLARTERETES